VSAVHLGKGDYFSMWIQRTGWDKKKVFEKIFFLKIFRGNFNLK
jgi:hypothetical protein